MRARMSLIVLLMMACPGWAQTPAAPAKPAAKPGTAAAAQKAAPAPAKQATKPATPAPKAPAAKPTTKATAGKPSPSAAAGPAKPTLKRTSNRRDPFISPIVKVTTSPCGTGKRCLAIGEIVVKGIAKTENGMLAMVENAARKAYFLRENDPVFNGVVVKITMDSIILRENIMDRLGHESTREVIKKIPATPAA